MEGTKGTDQGLGETLAALQTLVTRTGDAAGLVALSRAEALDVVAAAARLAGFAEAVSLGATAALARDADAWAREASAAGAQVTAEVAHSSTAAELAVVTPMGLRTAEQRLDLAAHLCAHLPRTWAALVAGELDPVGARRIGEGTFGMDPELLGALEERVLSRAVRRTPSQTARAVRRARLTLEPGSADQRRSDRRRCGVTVHDHCDGSGLADLVVTGPVTAITAAAARVDAMARASLAAEPDESGGALGLGEARMRAALDVLVGDPDAVTAAGGVVVHLNVVAPAGTVLGATDEPGDLAGFGPVPAVVVRALAGDARWRRWNTSDDGVVQGAGRSTYRPPAALAHAVKARDGTCRFPGCVREAEACDLDHTVPYPAGPTDADNLACLCRRHHRMKHHGGWGMSQEADGVVTWTSPTGRTVVTEPVRHTATRQPVDHEEAA
ncbi:MAG: DUF222 domain-containing protein [Kineosporiaceae bacterium]